MKLSPLEVDRYLYGEVENTFVNIVNGQFPTPREVDRELYASIYVTSWTVWLCFRPLSR